MWMMKMANKSLDDKLFEFTLRNLFPGRKESSLAEAMERALELKENKQDDSIEEENEWF